VKGSHPSDGRSAAILQVAVYDAVNGIVHRYQPYRITKRAPTGADPESAADAAAYTILLWLYPDHKQYLYQRFKSDLKKINASSAKVQLGSDWGRYVAEQIIKWREKDGDDRLTPAYTGSEEAGKWRPVDGQFCGDRPGHADIETFAVQSAYQFLPGPPPNLNSAIYAKDLDEVRMLGVFNSTVRTAEQTQNAEFLSDNIYIRWNRIARRFINNNVDIEDSARIFALLDIACADAGITTWKTKYTYGFWRPETAIVNDSKDPDRDWIPLVPTPNHPEYVCNHCSVSGAAAIILTHYFGKVGFTDISFAQPGVTRYYSSFSTLEEDVKSARLYGGVHFRNSINIGGRLGERIAQYGICQ